MHEQILPWVGLGVLFLLCLPIRPVQKLVLEVSTWVLRLGLIGLLAAGAYLWFRPGDLPTEVSGVLSDFPRLLAHLPAQGSPAFALCLVCWIVVALVPVLAALDVSRKLAGWRLRHLCKLATEPAAPVGVPVQRPVERRDAARAIASAAPRPAH